MFFWIFYRAYHDGPVLLVSIAGEVHVCCSRLLTFIRLLRARILAGTKTSLGRSSRTRRARSRKRSRSLVPVYIAEKSKRESNITMLARARAYELREVYV